VAIVNFSFGVADFDPSNCNESCNLGNVLFRCFRFVVDWLCFPTRVKITSYDCQIGSANWLLNLLLYFHGNDFGTDM